MKGLPRSHIAVIVPPSQSTPTEGEMQISMSNRNEALPRHLDMIPHAFANRGAGTARP